jgi:hypothetical protein
MHKARISSLKRDSKETSKAAASKDTGQLIVGPKRARSKVERNPVFLTTNNASVLARCNKMGRIAANCPDKDQETGLMTMFCTKIGTKDDVPSMIELMEELEMTR